MTLEPGTRLGPYEVRSLLGEGGMGQVFRARDTRLQRDVAIKVLPHSFAQDPERLHRFEQEARAVAALNHPNLLIVFDAGTMPVPGIRGDETSPYLVSELLEGSTLRERLLAGTFASRYGGRTCPATSERSCTRSAEFQRFRMTCSSLCRATARATPTSTTPRFRPNT
jgi:serine/threonine protein kinase